MDKVEAELQARVDAWERNAEKQKSEILDDPAALGSAISATTSDSTWTKFYYLAGVLTNQGVELANTKGYHPDLDEQTRETVKEFAALVETIVEDYILE